LNEDARRGAVTGASRRLNAPLQYFVNPLDSTRTIALVKDGGACPGRGKRPHHEIDASHPSWL